MNKKRRKRQKTEPPKASSPFFNLAQHESKPYFLPALGLCGLLMGILLFDANLSLTGDNAQFINLGRSLADGHGLAETIEGEPIPHTKYPFGFPLLQNEMPDYQARARCVVISTTFNLIPHSLLGAMTLGRNIVAFDLPSLREVIEHEKSGYLIPRYDTDAFAEQILQLTSTPVNPEIGRKARENVLAKCDYRLVASQYEAFFEKVKNN